MLTFVRKTETNIWISPFLVLLLRRISTIDLDDGMKQLYKTLNPSSNGFTLLN